MSSYVLVREYEEWPLHIHLVSKTAANMRPELKDWTVTINLRGHAVRAHPTLVVRSCKTDLAGCLTDNTMT